jgi:hypothetical protein
MHGGCGSAGVLKAPGRFLAGLLVVTLATGCAGEMRPAAPHGATRRPAGAAPLTTADHARACGSPRPFARAAAEEIMAGRLTIAPFAAVAVDPDRDGAVDWSLDPFHHPTWKKAFESAGWIAPLVDGYLAENRRPGGRAAAYRERAKALLRGWLRDVPTSGRSPGTLVCAARAFPGESWIEDQIPRQVDFYAAHWEGPWNHGLRRNLEVLRIACAYPASAWGGRPLRWRSMTRRQMAEAFEPNRLGPAVDRQGAANEQSTGYTKFSYGWWARAGRQPADCGAALPGEITARVGRMPVFLAHATQPDGRLVQLGDTYATTPGTVPGSPLEYAGSRG